MPSPDLRSLVGRMLVFERVATLGSFSAAARELRVARSAVSAAVSGLEEDLGVRLLHRTTRAVRPTEAGARFRRRCASVAREAAAAVEELAGEAAAASGVLRVTAPGGPFSRRLIVPVLAELLRELGLRVDLRTTDARLDLVQERLDVAVRLGRPPESEYVLKRLGRMEEVLVASPAVAVGLTDVAALESAPFVVHRSLPPRMRLTGRRGRHVDLRPAPEVVVDDGQILVEALCHGAGVGMAPDLYVAEELARGQLVRVLPELRGPRVEAFALVPTRRQLPLRTRRFLDALAVRFRTLRQRSAKPTAS